MKTQERRGTRNRKSFPVQHGVVHFQKFDSRVLAVRALAILKNRLGSLDNIQIA